MNNWVIRAKRYGGGMVVDKREWTELSYEEMRAKFTDLHNQMKIDGYWAQLEAFPEGDRVQLMTI